MNRPSAMVWARTDIQAALLPTTDVVQLDVPAVSSSALDVVGATALMSGATVFDERALASPMVKVDAPPEPAPDT